MSSPSASPGEVSVTIVRHGETSYNHSKSVQGHLDVPLNDQGLAQAATTGRVLAARGFQGFDRAWSSDLSRARVTARIILDKAGFEGMSVREDERLRERYLGTMQGEQNKRRDECTAADSKTIEPTSQFAGRLLSFWDEHFPSTLTPTTKPSTTNGTNEERSSWATPSQWLIVSHGGSIRQLLHSLLIDRSSSYSLSSTESESLDQVLHRRIANCCFTEIRMRRGEEGWKGVVCKYADEGRFEDSSSAPSPGRNEDVVE